jgi:hypothetical protein
MKQYSVRNFRNNLKEALGSLPVEIIKRGEVIAKVISPFQGTAVKNPIATDNQKVFVKNQRRVVTLCKHGNPKGLCKYGCK